MHIKMLLVALSRLKEVNKASEIKAPRHNLLTTPQDNFSPARSTCLSIKRVSSILTAFSNVFVCVSQSAVRISVRGKIFSFAISCKKEKL